MTRIFLVRHGQTVWNIEQRYQGHTDTPLTEVGRNQAACVAERLAVEPITAVYASDLGRAVETAGYIAVKHGLEVCSVPQLREFCFGDWEGETFVEISQRWPQLSTEFYRAPAATTIPGGETFSGLKERATTALEQIVAAHPEQSIVIVSHGGTIRTLLCGLLGVDLNRVWHIRQDNTAVNIVEYVQGTAMIALVNDTHHLLPD